MAEQQQSIRILTNPISVAELEKVALERFGDLVKAVVDVQQRIIAVGGELQADEEALLLNQGSLQENLWGIYIYVGQPREKWIEFDSLINIRPSQGYRTRLVENPATQQRVVEIVNTLIQ